MKWEIHLGGKEHMGLGPGALCGLHKHSTAELNTSITSFTSSFPSCYDGYSWLSTWLHLERTIIQKWRAQKWRQADSMPWVWTLRLESTPLMLATPSTGRTTEEGRGCVAPSSACPHLVSTSIPSPASEPTSSGFQHREKTSWDTQPRGTEKLPNLDLPFTASLCWTSACKSFQ